jgi:hypothetical protein
LFSPPPEEIGDGGVAEEGQRHLGGLGVRLLMKPRMRPTTRPPSV